MGKPARVAWLIFVGSYFVYEANLRPIAANDSLPAALLPLSILTAQTLQLDRFEPLLQGKNPIVPSYLHEKDHHFYSAYPVGQPILLTPLYVPIWLAAHPERWDVENVIGISRILEKVVAGAIAAAGAALFFVLLDRLTSRRNALILAAAYALGTSVWSISSQALWQHTTGGLLLVLDAVLCLQLWNENRESFTFLALAGSYAAGFGVGGPDAQRRSRDCGRIGSDGARRQFTSVDRRFSPGNRYRISYCGMESCARSRSPGVRGRDQCASTRWARGPAIQSEQGLAPVHSLCCPGSGRSGSMVEGSPQPIVVDARG